MREETPIPPDVGPTVEAPVPVTEGQEAPAVLDAEPAMESPAPEMVNPTEPQEMVENWQGVLDALSVEDIEKYLAERKAKR